MRQQGQQNRRGRARSGRKMQNPLSRNYDSNGPDVKIRGTAAHIAEKYTAMARDALSSGDPVTAENLFQHAEHYNRIIMAAQNPAQPDAQAPAAEQDGQQVADETSQKEERSERRPRNGKANGAANNNNRRRRRRPNGNGANGNGANMKNGSDAKEADSNIEAANTKPAREKKVEKATSAEVAEASTGSALL